MKVELKNVSTNERLSEETICFSADLYINGINVGSTSNRGHGGPTFYQGSTDEGRELIRQAEEHFKSLPHIEVDGGGGAPFFMPQSLEGEIDTQVERHLWLKTVRRNTRTGIVWGKDLSLTLQVLKFKRPISEMLKSQEGSDAIRRAVLKAKGELKEGESILNENIPQELLK